ncbi:hypothetical protein F5X99DRAFT_190005 [Biscogniauxia marginata]|nr:hypothetical protein F5X99DRAFT_190005 [Biscogniauxia marginata]
MRLSRALARARHGVPVIHAPNRQTPLLARAASSSSASASASSSLPPALTSSSSSFPVASSQPHKSLPSSRNTTNIRTLPVRTTRRHYASSSPSSTAPLKKTPLYDLHLAHGAKMVPFGGYEMPVQYAGLGVSASHHFTRSHASLFDVGHMVQHKFAGPGAAAFLQRVTPGSIAALPPHQSTLSALLWPDTGGIVDDTIVTRLPSGSEGEDLFYVVTNAACRDKDLAYLADQLAAWDGAEVRHEVLEGHGLVALQGPLAAEILSAILADPANANLPKLYFGQSRFMRVKVGPGARELPTLVLVSRGGYTGEDGFEISIPPDIDDKNNNTTVAVTEALLTAAGPEKLQLAGLGARDSLRLEAGMCLYGHDLDDSTTPVEGSLSWIVGKDRRDATSLADGAFHGAPVILSQLKPRASGVHATRRRVGLVVEGAPAREGAEIQVQEDGGQSRPVGVVTSGCPSPTLGKNIAMGYVEHGPHKAGTELQVVVRGRPQKAVVTKMPFVESKYYKPGSNKGGAS